MTRRYQRGALVLLSSALGVLFISWFLGRRAPRGTVELVSIRDKIEGFFSERSGGGSEVHAAERSTKSTKRAPLMVGSFDYSELPVPFARKLFPIIRKDNVRAQHDPHMFYRGRPGFRYMMSARGHPGGDYLMVNNSLGLRRETELSETQPDLRVLVTGDSHMEGVVPMPEHLTEVAEATLLHKQPGRSVEVINAGQGGYSFFNYYGVAEKFEYLEPDVFVVGVYGGNDFVGSLNCYRFFHKLPLGGMVPHKIRGEWKRLMEESSQLFAQSMDQAIKLHFQPRELRLAQASTAEFVQEMHGICQENGTKLVLMYIPSLLEVQPQFDKEAIDLALSGLGLAYEDLSETGDLADAMLDDAKALGIPCLDLRGSFRDAKERLFWEADHHLNTAGHALAAQELTGILEELGL